MTKEAIRTHFQGKYDQFYGKYLPGNDIAQALSITGAYVSKIKKEAIEKGVINRQGKYIE